MNTTRQANLNEAQQKDEHEKIVSLMDAEILRLYDERRDLQKRLASTLNNLNLALAKIAELRRENQEYLDRIGDLYAELEEEFCAELREVDA